MVHVSKKKREEDEVLVAGQVHKKARKQKVMVMTGASATRWWLPVSELN